MAKKKLVKEAGQDHFVEQSPVDVDLSDVPAEENKKQDAVKAPVGDKLITLHLPFRVKINGQAYVGRVTVPEKVAQVIIPMVQRKRASDAKVMTGKSFEVNRLFDNTLVVKEGKN